MTFNPLHATYQLDQLEVCVQTIIAEDTDKMLIN
jgi:hypothetical protein